MVASALYNPFGDDNYNFAVMELMNRHIIVYTKNVDDDNNNIPEGMDDNFWNQLLLVFVFVFVLG